MRRAAELADTARRAIVAGDAASLARAIVDNLDVRRSIYRLPPWQVQMADAARACGASANFAGSGGAIVGTYRTEATFDRLRNALASSGCRTLKPSVEVERSRSSLRSHRLVGSWGPDAASTSEFLVERIGASLGDVGDQRSEHGPELERVAAV